MKKPVMFKTPISTTFSLAETHSISHDLTQRIYELGYNVARSYKNPRPMKGIGLEPKWVGVNMSMDALKLIQKRIRGLWNSKSHETFVPLYDLRTNKVNQILTIRLDTTTDKLGKVKLHLDTSEILTMDGDFDYGRC